MAGELSCPHAGEPGCYVFANGEGQVLKIGKENRRIGVRIWRPGGRKAKKGEENFPEAKSWFKKAGPDIAVWAIPFEDDHWWMAAALEGFLHVEFLPERIKKNRKI